MVHLRNTKVQHVVHKVPEGSTLYEEALADECEEELEGSNPKTNFKGSTIKDL